MSLQGIIQGNYGFTIEITLTQGGTAPNMAAYAGGTVVYIFQNPGGTVTTGTASWKTDGSDAVTTFTAGSALLTTAGDWLVQPKVTKAGTVIAGEMLPFTVGRVLA